ncbi:MAG: M67 family metallopeptidase [Chloroflexi bacterium]|nr:M67 family metallopeptidase [Chloroflexota bacterium]
MVGRLTLAPALREQLLDHAREGAPDEVCGILAGRGERVAHVFPVRNTAESVSADQAVFRDRATGAATAGRAPVHYYMDPRDQLRVYNDIDALGLDLVGYYHSHTHSEARPSPTDIRLASDLSAVYLLVSLTEVPNVRAWRISKADPSDEDGTLQELTLADS